MVESPLAASVDELEGGGFCGMWVVFGGGWFGWVCEGVDVGP